MPPRRSRGRRWAAEPEDRVDHIERILEGLVQVVHDVHNNNNHDDAPQQLAMPVPGAGAMPQRSLNEMSQFREINRKRSGENTSRGKSSKQQSSGSSSGTSSNPQRSTGSYGSNRSNEVSTCPNCQKKHWGECRMGIKACYGCGQEGHQIKDCPMRNRIQDAGTSALASVQRPPVGRRDNQRRQGQTFCTYSRKCASYNFSSVRVYNSCEIRVNDVPMTNL
ncbi:hypothetical protein Acr_00g0034080 [Actinidia rufa]|uniref:CCHC-type domain-containing protein n=1 Tax=Actinidia rufa TaxID=165716 RepID=A0A7J0DGD8_9ERIC|nr:hypothetical protein Acr_00g0034080 [Actinidia rufa]